MSQAPQTDAAVELARPVGHDSMPRIREYVPVEFARQLERENAALQKQLEEWGQSTQWFAEWAEKKEDLERELAALREQVRRLEQDLAITRQLRCHDIVESEKEDV